MIMITKNMVITMMWITVPVIRIMVILILIAMEDKDNN